jgi:hypothetical protein
MAVLTSEVFTPEERTPLTPGVVTDLPEFAAQRVGVKIKQVTAAGLSISARSG